MDWRRPISPWFTKKSKEIEQIPVRMAPSRGWKKAVNCYLPIRKRTFDAVAGDASSLHGPPMMYRRNHRQSVGVFRTSILVAFCDADGRGCRRAAVGAAGALLGSSCLFFVIMAVQAWKFIHNFRAGHLNATFSATANCSVHPEPHIVR